MKDGYCLEFTRILKISISMNVNVDNISCNQRCPNTNTLGIVIDQAGYPVVGGIHY